MRKQTRMTRTGSHHRSSAVAPAASECQGDRQVLEAISEVVSRQRAALLARDIRAMNQTFEALLALLGDLAVVSGSAGGPPSKPGDAGAAALASLAGRVHDQLAINRALVYNGLTIVDHYMAAMSEAAVSANQALFSGVG
jgi:hypothetical protein